MADTDVFAALSDPTRRQIVEWLSAEPGLTTTTMADRLPISRQAVSRHVQELSSAGVVSSTKVGRETRYRLNSESLDSAAQWLEDRGRAWDRTLRRLKDQVE